jgi:hypothetical protein
MKIILMISCGLKESIELYIEHNVNTLLRLKLQELQDRLILAYPEKRDLVAAVVNDHSYPVGVIIRLDREIKDRGRKEINDTIRCQARTGVGSQCRRPMAADTVYCMSHKQKLPHGSIHDKLPPKVHNKRGRKKCKGVFKTEDLDPSLYRRAALIEIDSTPYLVDENLIIYKFNENIIVGYINGDSEVCWV